jgi:hypothetical protein
MKDSGSGKMALFYPVRRCPGTAKMHGQACESVRSLLLKRTVFLPLITLLVLAAPASAVVVENLYRAEVEVADTGSRELQKATRAGLAQVLVKVSGSGKVLRDAEVRAALDQSQRYMQRYQYLRQPDRSIRIQIHYDSQLVTELMTGARQSLWTANRPPVLIWLVLDDGRTRSLANAESHPEMLAALNTELERRGVPAVFPLQDLEDAMALSIHDLWRMDQIAIFRASQRYGVGNILVGRITSLSGGRWMGDWLYLREDADSATSFYGSELQEFSAAGIDFVADHMAERYAVAAGTSQDKAVLIRVDDLGDYADYREALAYFEGIELVDAAWPAYVEGQSIVFRLQAQAEADQLHRIFALNRKLQRQESPTPLPRGPINTQLTYRWTP